MVTCVLERFARPEANSDPLQAPWGEHAGVRAPSSTHVRLATVRRKTSRAKREGQKNPGWRFSSSSCVVPSAPQAATPGRPGFHRSSRPTACARPRASRRWHGFCRCVSRLRRPAIGHAWQCCRPSPAAGSVLLSATFAQPPPPAATGPAECSLLRQVACLEAGRLRSGPWAAARAPTAVSHVAVACGLFPPPIPVPRLASWDLTRATVRRLRTVRAGVCT